MKLLLLSDGKLNELRGKAMVGHITQSEIMAVLNHLTMLETWLDEAEMDDTFGTEGWRHAAGIPNK